MDKLQKLIEIANKEYDGHFTLLKFTTNWRCCFGTVDDVQGLSSYMSHGETLEEAVEACIVNRTDIYDILKMNQRKMIYITDEQENVSKLKPLDKIKIIRESGTEAIGDYLGECSKYREFGHWYFTGSTHDEKSYCDYYWNKRFKKYVSLNEYSSCRTKSIDEENIARIIILRDKLD